jgi:hypothetical protein
VVEQAFKEVAETELQIQVPVAVAELFQTSPQTGVPAETALMES